MPKDYRNYIQNSSPSNYLQRKVLGGVFNFFDLVLDESRIQANGGFEFEPGNGYKYHIFTSPGNFVIENIGSSDSIDVFMVAGGGGGGSSGGGAGGVRQFSNIPVSLGIYPISVGSGGGGIPSSNPHPGASRGVETIAFGYIAAGGGGGAGRNTDYAGTTGGSGGGGGFSGSNFSYGYNPSTPSDVLAAVPAPFGGPLPFPYAFTQGFPGGVGAPSVGSPSGLTCGGGGGAGGAGADGNTSSLNVLGGIGIPAFSGTEDIPPSYGTPGPTPGRWFAGGGPGRGPFPAGNGVGSSGGGGFGVADDSTTGGGQFGIVIIRYGYEAIVFP